ncbi:glucan biosynthesis protein [Enterovirga rhinocerotis]|uniref:Glucans biosynthesis protein n=1 Tax=Enterovirga rhinocerotis TaxID=1339210 RepID=A0A4R7BJ60_9HYPH|nr:glucan biosynthesis protein G [Enterovirga rhinocerotis]TDR85191.1 glucans biosynthesis protein [Enterovirga rhinocerotis]
MIPLTRRHAVGSLLSLAALGPAASLAQQPAPQAQPGTSSFRFEEVVRRARELAALPFDAAVPPLPEPLATLDPEAYRGIRFRPDRAFLAQGGSRFRVQLFHLGPLYPRPVTVNLIRDGVPSPIPYQTQLFDFGSTKIERPLPVNLGFAGLRIHYPLNNPTVFDELLSFLGASYFRFLGRQQRYGLSGRGLAVGVGGREQEEFPFFREFWIETPAPGADRLTVFALLDGAAVAGAYRFDVYPSVETEIEIAATLFPRRPIGSIGLAPLTSMFFSGENDPRPGVDFPLEQHDSDGLLVQSGSGEWIWRPLRNPPDTRVSGFQDKDPRGFGLMQRDRRFESYQALDAGYERRPSYWVRPLGPWGEGRIELVEIASQGEPQNNIVAYWTPSRPIEAGRETSFAYRIKALGGAAPIHPGGRVVNTFSKPIPQAGTAGGRRFMIDFAGGDLGFYLQDPSLVQPVASASQDTRIVSASLARNEHVNGFRVMLDVRAEPGRRADLRVFLKAEGRVLSETWAYPWIPA